MKTSEWMAPMAALAVLLLAGCGTKNQAEQEPVTAGDSVTGTVRQVGNTPFQRIVVAGEEGSVRITGDLEAEIVRLVGARVRVVGSPPEGEEAGRTLRAVGYEILSVDGATPRVGILRHEAGEGYRLEVEDGEAVPLRGVPNGLGARLGAKVWVVLSDGGSVQRYGVLREPEDAGA